MTLDTEHPKKEHLVSGGGRILRSRIPSRLSSISCEVVSRFKEGLLRREGCYLGFRALWSRQ